MVGKRVSKKDAKLLANKLGIDLDIIGLEQWQNGIKAELEHGKGRHKKLNVTTINGQVNLLMTAKIAATHLEEFPDYYIRLERMEKQADKYWGRRDKPCIFLAKHK
jgi:hypothetical protein